MLRQAGQLAHRRVERAARKRSKPRAAELLQDICLRQGIGVKQITLHSDNGSPMKGETMLATLQHLGVAHSRSRATAKSMKRCCQRAQRSTNWPDEKPDAGEHPVTMDVIGAIGAAVSRPLKYQSTPPVVSASMATLIDEK